jgi:hypothetical protein
MDETSKPLRTQQYHKALVKRLGVDRHITPTKVPTFTQPKLLAFTQPKLPFYLVPASYPEPLLLPKEREDNGATELLLDALIGEACRDNDILEKHMIV